MAPKKRGALVTARFSDRMFSGKNLIFHRYTCFNNFYKAGALIKFNFGRGHRFGKVHWCMNISSDFVLRKGLCDLPLSPNREDTAFFFPSLFLFKSFRNFVHFNRLLILERLRVNNDPVKVGRTLSETPWLLVKFGIVLLMFLQFINSIVNKNITAAFLNNFQLLWKFHMTDLRIIWYGII